MEYIFYEQAVNLLGVSLDTLKRAISERGVLTRAGRQGRNMLLIKEQVLLFAGPNPRTGRRKRLSFEALTPVEKRRWQELADAVKDASTEQEIPAEQLQAYIDEQVASQVERQVEPIMHALSGVVSQWNTSHIQEREVPKVRPFPSQVKVKIPLPV